MVDNVDNDRLGPRRSDPSHANATRVYEYLKGGHHHFEADRDAARKFIKHMPHAPALARSNLEWVQRVVRHLVSSCGIRQFMDLGAGIPSVGNVHEVAQEIEPTCRVVYADYDRVAYDKGSEILAGNPDVTFLHADLRQPETILQDPATTAILDFTKPIALISASTLHFVEDRDEPIELLDHYKAALVPGSYIGLTHLTWQFLDSETRARIDRDGLGAYNELVTETITARDLDTILRFFTGTELVEPGVVPLVDWKPDRPVLDTDHSVLGRNTVVGGVGRVV